MSDKLNYLVFFILSCTLVAVSLFSEPQRNGDGHEYSLITKAFVNHLTPNITSGDVSDRLSDIIKYKSSGYIQGYFENIKEGILNNEANAGNVGIYRAENGNYYGYHFWFYPLLSAVSEKVLSLLNLNPLKSFQLTNAILLILSLYLIAIREKKSSIAQFVFLAGGVVFYLKWSHPEVMIYTFIFFAFYYLITGRPYICAAFISLASIQVVSLSLLFVIIPIYIAIHTKENIISASAILLKSWKIWLYGAISISSIVFYYFNYNKFSLIGDQASKLSNINLDHFISYYFDLDQGLWVGAPWLIILFLLLKWRGNKVAVSNLIFSFVFSVVICIPLMANNAFNSGQSIFQRYALYSIAPIIAWSCVYCSQILNTVYKKAIIIICMLTYLFFCRGYIAEGYYLMHKPWTEYLLENYPKLYAPEPDIFIVRTFPPNEWINGKKDSYAYKDKNGIITKIIYRETDKKLFSDTCSGEYKDFYTHKPIVTSNSSTPRYGWRYITGSMYCDGFTPYRGNKYSVSIPNTIDFKKQGFPDFIVGVSGVGQEEQWGRWSEGSEVKLFLDIKLNKNVTFYAKLTTFGPNAGKPLMMTVNDQTKELIPYKGEDNLYFAKFNFPETVTNPTINIKVPEPISPAQLGLNDDVRKIGLGLIKIYWE